MIDELLLPLAIIALRLMAAAIVATGVLWFWMWALV